MEKSKKKIVIGLVITSLIVLLIFNVLSTTSFASQILESLINSNEFNESSLEVIKSTFSTANDNFVLCYLIKYIIVSLILILIYVFYDKEKKKGLYIIDILLGILLLVSPLIINISVNDLIILDVLFWYSLIITCLVEFNLKYIVIKREEKKPIKAKSKNLK